MEKNTKKFVTFLLRLTEEEKIVFTELADESGYSLTQWFRMMLKQAAVEEYKKQNRTDPFVKTKRI